MTGELTRESYPPARRPVGWQRDADGGWRGSHRAMPPVPGAVVTVELSKRELIVLIAALLSVADGKAITMAPSQRHEVLKLHDKLVNAVRS